MIHKSQGSLWRKWDLHVHTPLSITQQYGGNTSETWERFFQELESLPPEIKVLGINDYIFIDGYERVVAEKAKGRLSNIDLILPVIELRVEQFSGTSGDLNRINYHVIFSDEVSPAVIRNQFIAALRASYKFSSEYDERVWNGVVTDIQSLQELGEVLTQNTPADKKKSLPSPLQLGFANLNYPLQKIEECLSHHNFLGKHITAVGKAEWSQLRWDSSTASKKDLISGVDIVFTAAKTIEDAQKSVDSLIKQEVNSKLIDCSDAHYWVNSTEHIRLGQCFSWIKADTTFEGLKLAVQNYEDRVYIGHEPNKIRLVRENKTKYIRSLKINKKEESNLREKWFSSDILFNPDLVAIIGNKGNAKSALTDILALCGNTRINDFSFLNKERFCDHEKKAKSFEAHITWESGACKTTCLFEPVNAHDTELVRYVPQSFFEKVTNEINSNADGDFDKELQKVIFSHIPKPDRLGKETLGELLRYHTENIQVSLVHLKEKLRELNIKLLDAEEEISEKSLGQLASDIETKKQVLSAHEDNEPEPVERPESQSQKAQELESHRKELEAVRTQFTQKNEKFSSLKKKISELKQLIAILDQKSEEVQEYRQNVSVKMNELDLPFDIGQIFNFDIDTSILRDEEDRLSLELLPIQQSLDEHYPDSLATLLKEKHESVQQLQEGLNLVDKAYQTYLTNHKEWQVQKQKLVGSSEDIGSLKFLEEKLRYRKNNLPDEIAQFKGQRQNLVRDIYEEVSRLERVLRDVAAPVQSSIDRHQLTEEGYGLDFNVKVTLSRFEEKFLGFINQGRIGSFSGKDEGKERLHGICEKYNFGNADDAVKFIEEILEALNYDCRTDLPQKVDLENQLRNSTVEEVYNFLFSLEYLKPEYSLQLDGKEMKQLSPGERGVLLLIFYLLIDMDDCPLLIDQPEENLDNQSIYNLLVPAIKEAKKHRQIFLVTHNPNLAIVCNADQIIHCSIDKNDAYKVNYESGAIENPIFNKHALDILEGTKPAFDVRQKTYLSLLKE